jgi:phosphatidylglycerol:prolipoprotein diacylglycerol transferase
LFPRLFQLGPFTLHSYGLLVVLGFGAGLWMAARQARRSGLDPGRVLDLGILLALAAVAGSKILMLVEDWRFYSANPGAIFTMATLQAAGVFYGGLAAALAAAVWYVRRHRMPFLATADAFVPGLVLGHAIGRLGCFAAGCCWGRPARLPWAVTFTDPYAHDLVGVPLGIALHPAQLYEVAALLAILAIQWPSARRQRFPGQLLSLYVILYGLARFLLEFTRDRAGSQMPLGLLSLSQLVALLMIPAGVWLWIKCAPGSARREAATSGRRQNA